MKNFQTILNDSQKDFEKLFESNTFNSNIDFDKIYVQINDWEAKIKINNNIFLIGYSNIEKNYYVKLHYKKYIISNLKKKIDNKFGLSNYLKIDSKGELNQNLLLLVNNFSTICDIISKNIVL